jgi:hypothetical protein
MDELAKYLKAMLMLDLAAAQNAAEREGRPAPKLELLLADAGFGNREAAELLGKTVAATAKAISRARAARSKSGEVAVETEEVGNNG